MIKDDISKVLEGFDRGFKEGIIVYLDDQGSFGYVKEKDSPRQYIFNYYKIRGFYGQSPGRLNLRIGSRVTFQVEDDIVKSLAPPWPRPYDEAHQWTPPRWHRYLRFFSGFV